MRPTLPALLDRLCIPREFLGYEYLCRALELRLDQPDGQLTKWLYPEVAKTFGTNWKSVDRNIRTAVGAGWKRGGRPVLEELAGMPLRRKPSNGAFLKILVRALQTEP